MNLKAYESNLQLARAVVLILIMALMGDVAHAENIRDCENKQLSVSALDRALYMGVAITTIKLLNTKQDEKAKNYLHSVLQGDVELSKSLLVLMEKGPNGVELSPKKFEDTRTGVLFKSVLDNKVSSDKPDTILPKDLRDKFGNEGVALFVALVRASEFLNSSLKEQ